MFMLTLSVFALCNGPVSAPNSRFKVEEAFERAKRGDNLIAFNQSRGVGLERIILPRVGSHIIQACLGYPELSNLAGAAPKVASNSGER
jgi:hypothetical protein